MFYNLVQYINYISILLQLSPNGTIDLKVLDKLYKGGNMTETVSKIVIQEWSTCNSKIGIYYCKTFYGYTI